eukprot:Partr_v1_DN26249_c0_g1_i1_m48730 putative DNA polymerase kappa
MEMDDEDDDRPRTSKFEVNQERRDAKTQQRIAQMKQKYSQLSPADSESIAHLAQSTLARLEQSRDLTRTIVHVDMDMFFAAVETLYRPELKFVPMAVGGSSMLCTANYEARKFGVRAAMPGFKGRELCPHLVIVKPDFQKYKQKSNEVQNIFRLYDPQFDMVSLDEGYLDLTDYMRTNGVDAVEAVSSIREHIFSLTGLTASAGVACNRLLAKICSDINKPNGQFFLPMERKAVLEFISSQPVRKIPGIGKVTEKILSAFDIQTCGNLFDSRNMIFALMSPTSAEFLLRVSIGIGSNIVGVEWNRKSISVERTFEPTDSEEKLTEKLVLLCHKLSEDLEKENLSGKTVTLKIKTDEFEIRSRAKTVSRYINKDSDIFDIALQLLQAEFPVKLRLMGIRLSSFADDKSSKDITGYFRPSDSGQFSADQISAFSCPVCMTFIKESAVNNDNSTFNQHIDLCLNRSAVHELLVPSTQKVSPKPSAVVQPKKIAASKRASVNGSVAMMESFLKR